MPLGIVVVLCGAVVLGNQDKLRKEVFASKYRKPFSDCVCEGDVIIPFIVTPKLRAASRIPFVTVPFPCRDAFPLKCRYCGPYAQDRSFQGTPQGYLPRLVIYTYITLQCCIAESIC